MRANCFHWAKVMLGNTVHVWASGYAAASSDIEESILIYNYMSKWNWRECSSLTSTCLAAGGGLPLLAFALNTFFNIRII